ncbi:serine/threonine-protein kinase-like protein CCR1 [Phragmites australis]|uniref:serine/threonine-protein kinase-like protein CCR1 n=1 Tax=Phragmites australis TaxID=29695 RepID=UPI002D78B5BD|nr:serine/threonine-protein kinase-like protein CCR1 [Phragmites australis]
MHDAVVAAVHHAVVASAAAALVALAVALFLLWRKRLVAAARAADGAAVVPGPAATTAPLRVVPLADVERATDGFHPSRVIGQGRHFAVYAAAPGIAAKRMHPHLVLGDPGGRRFPAAVRSLAVPPHPNLAALVGLSEGPGERVLLVERAPAGAVSLDRVLGGDDAHPPLSWHQRAAVAAGAARGLAHLHAHGVAHGRVRPRNLLVNANAGARWRHATRLTDYGLAGFLDRADAHAETDVYMFGAVLLELLTGRRWDGGRLADWALPRIRAGTGPGALAEVLDVARAGPPRDKAEARLLARTARVALACVGNDGRSRPGMAEVSAILSDVEAAYRGRKGAPEGEEEEDDGDGDEGRLSGCLLAPSRSAHKGDKLLRLPV